MRDELWFRGAKEVSGTRLSFSEKMPIPAQAVLVEKLVGELSQPTYDFTSSGKHIVESKKDMKKRGVPSPNLADAFLLTFAAGTHLASGTALTDMSPHSSWRAA